MAAVDCEHIDKVYPDGTRALGDCSLTVADGELVVLVGPSGCGKSTLLRIVAGLETISGGTLRIGGRVANELSPRERNVAMVFQDYSLYPHMTVGRNLEYPLRMRAMSSDEIRRRVGEVAELLEIGSVLDRLPRELSGGQRQRVAMGRALVREPAVFLLDEPLSNLDAKLRQDVRAEIAALQRRTTTTMIYVTHDQTEAMTLGHRVAVLNRGVLEQVAPPRELYERPINSFVASFIGTPPMNLFRTKLDRADAGTLSFAVGDQRVTIAAESAAGASLTALAGREVTVGVRPEHVMLVGRQPANGGNRDDAAGLAAVVEHVESLGHETLVRVMVGSTSLMLRVPGMAAIEAAERVRVRFDERALYFFDDDGRALTTSAADCRALSLR